MGRCALGSMTAISRKPDPRFVLHSVQPRGKYLDRQQRKLCKVDKAFMLALRDRVSNPDRWRAFMANSPYFMGRECVRCQSRRRRVYSGACYDCMLTRNQADFKHIRSGIHPPAKQSREGWLDRHERQRRDRFGEFVEYRVGQYTARQYPTGRVSLDAPHLHISTQDMQKSMDPARIYQLGMTDPDFLQLLQRLGWA